MTEQQMVLLVQRVRLRDQQAFTTLCEMYAKSVLFCCLHILGSAQAAQEAAQEVFLKIQKEIVSLNEPQMFGVWLNRLMLQACGNAQRKREALSVGCTLAALLVPHNRGA